MIIVFTQFGAEEEIVTEEEIRMMIDVGEEKGSIEENEKELINNVFEFNDKVASEVMIHRKEIYAIDVKSDIADILTDLKEYKYSRIPVYEENIDNIIGILQTRDYLEALSEGKNVDIKELLTEVHFIYKSRKLSDILTDFKAKKLHMAIVTDEYGGMLGIVTMEDLLEELVGEIWDEDEEEERTFTKLKDGRYIISGDMDLTDLFDIFEINDDDEIESVSVGGFIAEQLGTIPTVNQSVRYKDIQITVKRIKNNRIQSAFVSKIESE